MIEGVVQPDEGEIIIDGYHWNENSRYLKSILGVSFQETRFMDKATVEETLSLFSAFYATKKDRIYEIMDMVGLNGKKSNYVDTLSGGQKQKLAIGIALLNDPKILMLDEPTTGLDPQARREIWEILKKLKTQGRTMILTTHYMEEAQYLCDKIMIMHTGKILSQGKIDDLLKSHNDEGGIIEIMMNTEAEAVKLFEKIFDLGMRANLLDKKIIVKSREPVAALKSILSIAGDIDVWIHNLQCRTITLDDLFILLAGQKLYE
jgi:ABC-2 type transport system ATP-binding protein